MNTHDELHQNELRSMIADTAERLFTDNVTKTTLDRFEEGQWPQTLWSLVQASGFLHALAPEAAGGIGASLADVQPILRAIGYWQVPLPLAETMLAALLLGRAGLAIPDGPLTVIARGRNSSLDFTRDGDALRVEGKASAVPWARHCDHLVVSLRLDGRPTIALIERGQAAIKLTERANIAKEPRDDLVFDGARATLHAPLTMGLREPIWALGALMRSAAMAGALQSLLDQSVRYANERVQFGKAIGRNQAIQQSLAQLAGDAAAAAMAAQTALASAPDASSALFDIAVAKVRCGEAANRATSIAHQVHGAIGFTYEHSLHYATRRLWSWREEFGSEAYWAERLGDAAIAAGADGFWPRLTERSLVE